jgi:manganese transport protein
MGLKDRVGDFLKKDEGRPRSKAFELMRYIGPGLLVTVGFIDPGNWASNMAAGSDFGYSLLWVVTLSTVMLIMLQHNAAHLGIASGLCLSEAATAYLPPALSKAVLGSAVLASISTALAEVLGGAIALSMLFGMPVQIGAFLVAAASAVLLWTNSYKKTERWIIGFVSVIGFSFIYELTLAKIDWPAALGGWVTPEFPKGSMPLIMGILGAVVMPHNLFLHSENIQSREWNLKDEKVIKHQLRFEFLDTLLSMLAGMAINSAMIILAASCFHSAGTAVTDLPQAGAVLAPLLGNKAFIVFALALLFSGLSSSITAGMAGGSIFAGMFGEPFDIKDRHSGMGAGIALGMAPVIILFIRDPFQALIISQIALSIQLPLTVFTLVYLTSSRKVMGKFANSAANAAVLWAIALAVTALNVALLVSLLPGSRG